MLRTIILLLLIASQFIFINPQCNAFPNAVDFMVTDTMELGNPSDTYAKEDYNVVFSGTQSLGTYANIFSAFAIAALQTPSGQNYYSITVDKVFFSNTNTVMRVFMDYYNVDRTIKTTWTKVKLSYIVVSPQFEGVSTGGYQGNSYVWAYSIQISPPVNNVAIDTSGYFRHSNAAGYCGFIDSYPPIFGTNCPDAKVIYHYYIMGFRYDSTSDASYEFRVSILPGDGSLSDETLFPIVIDPTLTTNGPKLTVNSYGGFLKKVKIGMVFTVLRDYSHYPSQSSGPSQKFKYSGLFMPVNSLNSNVFATNTATQNINHFSLGYIKYKFFGFSSIQLQPNLFSVDFSLDLKDMNTLMISTPNKIFNAKITADIYSTDINTGCISTMTQRTQVASEQYTSSPLQTSGQQYINKISSGNGILPDGVNQYVFDVYGNSVGADASTVAMTIQLVYTNLVAGREYILGIAFNELSAIDLPAGWSFRYSLQVDGSTIFTDSIIANATENDKVTRLAKIINSISSTVTISIVFARNPAQNIHFHLNFALYQVNNVFDPISQCCATTCPSNTGLSLTSNPYTCVQCNSNNGQTFNPTTNQCECNPGYYLASSASQLCLPCTTPLCSTCSPVTPSLCLTCVVGAQLQPFYGTCSCQSGLIQQNGKCSACNYKCSSCSLSSTCSACSDSAHRNILNGCNCVDGYYDNGQPTCLACSSNCRTCISTASQCTSCYDNQNKHLQGSQCICNKGYYATSDSQGNFQCQKCSSQCDECIGNSYTCVQCDATQNKIPGYDSSGHLTCQCASGYSSDTDGKCIQSDCTNDQSCAQCSNNGGNKICLACKISLNRILDTSTYKCICKQGYYQNSNGLCSVCPDACATCQSSTFCNTCVAGATKTSSNLCACQSGAFFTTTPTRYCRTCSDNCQTCDSAGNCAVCLSNYQNVQGQCVCGVGKYINQIGQCSACSVQCNTCQNFSKCKTCKNGYLLQQSNCVTRCSLSYFKSGSQCLSCPSGCILCNQANVCQVCQNGLNLFNGKCYDDCPSGSIRDPTSVQCAACNYPCKTCVSHPSKCTSCQSDTGSLMDGSCTVSCPPGTYANGGVCQPCDFSCSTCAGSARLCTSCPDRYYLFNGACYDYCPQFNSRGQCITTCPAGFYLSSSDSCVACPSICQQCSNERQCTKCSSTTYAYLGQCLSSCPQNTYVLNSKQCAQCDVSCKSCSSSPTNCTECATGYSQTVSSSRLRTICVKDSSSTPSCTSHQYLNSRTNRCSQCSNECQTCSDSNTCTSCYNNVSPSRGQCNSNSGGNNNGGNSNGNLCSSNCNQCTSSTVCTQCNFGFNLYNMQCVSTCPYPLTAINNLCVCSSGIFYLNQCISSCPTGYTAIANQCQQCSSNCKECSQKKQYCTACPSGYKLNANSKACEKIQETLPNPSTCPLGQYDQGGICKRYCSNNLVYQNGLCYYTCLEDYYDNGQGGCVLKTSQTITCPSSQYLSFDKKTCVNVCPQDYFGNSLTKNCQQCPSNCVYCSSSTTCTVCQSDYRLDSGSCILPQSNPATNCQSGFYYNNTFNYCFPCQQPCSTCSDSIVCKTCIPGYNFLLGQCTQQFTVNCNPGLYKDQNGNCQSCVSPCLTCSSPSICITCISGYQLNGNSCTAISQSLVQLGGIQIQSSYRRGNSVIISILLPAIPSGLTYDQKSRFFNVKQSNLVNTIQSVTQWQSDLNEKRIFVAVNFQSIEGSSFLFLSLSVSVLGQSYANIGYRINDQAYKAVSVYQTLADAPDTIQIPIGAQSIPYVISS